MAAAAWSEFAPAPGVEINVLAGDVTAGTPLDPDLVQTRRVADAGFVTVTPHGVALIDLKAGDPLLASMVGEVSIPADWVTIDAELPEGARPGQTAVAIVTAAPEGAQPIEFPAVVVRAGRQDAFGAAAGSIAVPPEWAASAGQAVAEGRLVIGVKNPHR